MKRLLLSLCLLATCVTTARADNIDDLRDPRLPAAAEWDGVGHSLDWQVQQIRDGHRLIPTLTVPFLKPAMNPKNDAKVKEMAPALGEISDWRSPLILRDGSQIAVRMTGTAPRDVATPTPGGPTTTQDAEGYRLALPDSAVQWRVEGDGVTLDSTPWCDPFAPADKSWMVEAKALATSRYMQQIQAACPHACRLIYADNNEAGYPKFKQLAVWNAPKKGNPFWAWKPDLGSISVRMRDAVARDNLTPDQGYALFYRLRAAQYESYFTTLGANFGIWSDRELQSIGYSVTDGENLSFDGWGPSQYPGRYLPANLLAPDHAAKMAAAVDYWRSGGAKTRVVFLWAGAKPCISPATDGFHEVVSPEIFVAYCGHVAWQAREQGAHVLLQHWIDSGTSPTEPFFHADKQDLPAVLKSLGRDDLVATTHGEYSIAPAKACDAICAAGVRDFWIAGTNVTATVSDPRVRVWGVQLDGKVMVYAWSPSKLSGTVDVTTPLGTVSIDVPQPRGHWVVGDSSAEKDAAVAVATQRAQQAAAATQAAESARIALDAAKAIQAAADAAAASAKSAADAIPVGRLGARRVQ